MFACMAKISTTYDHGNGGYATKEEFTQLRAQTLEELYRKMAGLKSQSDRGFDRPHYENDPWWYGRPSKEGTKTTFGPIDRIAETILFDAEAMEATPEWAAYQEKIAQEDHHIEESRRKAREEHEQHEREQLAKLQAKYGEEK